jgi:translation initiation factor 3 subunit C
VHSLISKMIINKEIQASWDQPTATLVMHKAQSSRLQLLALQLADKVPKRPSSPSLRFL